MGVVSLRGLMASSWSACRIRKCVSSMTVTTFVGAGQLGQYDYGWYGGQALTQSMYKQIYQAEGLMRWE
jgi:hypothetical protein